MKKRNIWLSITAVILALGVTAATILVPRMPKEEAAVFPVTMVGYTDYYSGSAESYGLVATDKVQPLYLSESQSVTEILVYPGQSVKKGDVLFTYDTTLSDLAIKRKDLSIKQLEMQLKTAQTELTALKKMKPIVYKPGSSNTTKTDYTKSPSNRNQLNTVYSTKTSGLFTSRPLYVWLGQGTQVDEAMIDYLFEEATGNPSRIYVVFQTTRNDRTNATFDSHFGVSFQKTYEAAPIQPVLPPPVTIQPTETTTEPAASTEPTESSTEPVADTIPTESSEPAETTKTTEPSTEPAADTIPTESSEPAETTENTEPSTEPAADTIPTESSEPAETTENTEPSTEPVADTIPTESSDPAETTETTDPSTEPASNTEPTESSEPAQTADAQSATESETQPVTAAMPAPEQVFAGYTMSFFDPPSAPEEDNGTVEWNDGYTSAELTSMRNEKQEEIKQLQFDIKMGKAELNIMKKEAEDGKVLAEFDGIVSEILEPTAALESGEPIMKVTGGGGYYVEGTISELALDTLQIGQAVTVNSWDTGMIYTGSVVEIGAYPAEDQNVYGASNVTFYPYKVFIDESADLQEGFYVSMTYQTEEQAAGILYLQNAFLRSEGNRTYVYIRGAEGLLEKRYLECGVSTDGYMTPIYAGITEEDYLAFPYGSAITEGAPTYEGTDQDLYGY